MAKRLVTIATFDQPAQARLAQNALKEAGVAATVSDENLVAMDWLLSNAVGGVKVQVWEEDADLAVKLLEKRFGEHGEGFGSEMSEEEFAAIAESTMPEDGEEPEHPPSPHEEHESPPPAPDNRDKYALRLVFTAILVIITMFIFPPIGFLIVCYGVYLFLNAAFGDGSLSSRGKFNLFVGAAIILPGLIWFMIISRGLLARP